MNRTSAAALALCTAASAAASGLTTDCHLVGPSLTCCHSWQAEATRDGGAGALLAADSYDAVASDAQKDAQLSALACSTFGGDFCGQTWGAPHCGPCEASLDAGTSALPTPEAVATGLANARAWAQALPQLAQGSKDRPLHGKLSELGAALAATLQAVDAERARLDTEVSLGSLGGDAPSQDALGPPEEGSAFLLWSLGSAFGGHVEEQLARCERAVEADALSSHLRSLQALPELTVLSLPRPATARKLSASGDAEIVLGEHGLAVSSGTIPAGSYPLAFVTADGKAGPVHVERRVGANGTESYRLTAALGSAKESIEVLVEAACPPGQVRQAGQCKEPSS